MHGRCRRCDQHSHATAQTQPPCALESFFRLLAKLQSSRPSERKLASGTDKRRERTVSKNEGKRRTRKNCHMRSAKPARNRGDQLPVHRCSWSCKVRRCAVKLARLNLATLGRNRRRTTPMTSTAADDVCSICRSAPQDRATLDTCKSSSGHSWSQYRVLRDFCASSFSQPHSVLRAAEPSLSRVLRVLQAYVTTRKIRQMF
jgi:hypothetical protein